MKILIILFALVAGVYAYHLTSKNDPIFEDITSRQVVPEFQENSRIIDKRVLLRKNKSITVNKNRLVFKGVKDKTIHLDVYFLELDPEYAYPHYISKADAHKKIRLGDSTFQFLKVSKGALQLKIIDLYRS